MSPILIELRIEFRLKAGARGVRDVALFIISREQTQ